MCISEAFGHAFLSRLQLGWQHRVEHPPCLPRLSMNGVRAGRCLRISLPSPTLGILRLFLLLLALEFTHSLITWICNICVFKHWENSTAVDLRQYQSGFKFCKNKIPSNVGICSESILKISEELMFANSCPSYCTESLCSVSMGNGSKPPCLAESMNIQVPYIKWHSICI